MEYFRDFGGDIGETVFFSSFVIFKVVLVLLFVYLAFEVNGFFLFYIKNLYFKYLLEFYFGLIIF